METMAWIRKFYLYLQKDMVYYKQNLKKETSHETINFRMDEILTYIF